MDFFQFWDKLNGKPYQNGTPAPVKYNFLDYARSISSNPINGTENGEYQLRSIDDIGLVAADDAVAEFLRIHQGKNPYRIGEPMSDDELRRFYGQGDSATQ